MYGVILAGGSGTRFWPLSRKKIPKQFLKLFSERTLIEETVQRLSPLIPKERIIVVTTEDYARDIKRILKGVPPENIIAEPTGRNTAPAIALAAFKLSRNDNEVMGVFPSDHMITNKDAFIRVLSVANEIAKGYDKLVTLGMKPDKPETGYGYIELGSIFKKSGGFSVYKVKRFVEKPDLEKAKAFLRDGNFMWNSGMFVWRVGTFLKELEKQLPSLYRGIKDGIKIKKGGDFSIDKEIYSKIESISVDYGIMEKSEDSLVIPADIGWSDIGSWPSLAELLTRDDSGNAVIANGAFMHEVKNSLFFAKDKFVAGIGVEDVIVVSAGNAILVCNKNRSQEVKRIVEFLNSTKKEEFL